MLVKVCPFYGIISCALVLMAGCGPIRTLSHVGFTVENVPLLYEVSRFPRNCCTETNLTTLFCFVFNYAFPSFSIFCMSLTKKSQLRCSRGSSKLCFKENPCLLKLSDLPGRNQTENRPLLCFCSTLKLHEATYPHLNPHTAVQDVYLHFRANEWLQCKRATRDINIQISISGVNFRSLSPDLWFRLERMHQNKQFKSNILV